MQRFARVSIATVGRRAFSDAPAAATVMTLNFTTPHSAVYTNKEVSKVTLPGEMGEFGVTMNHSPIISQLRAGVVQIEHLGGEKEEFFVAGGFSITNDKSVTDVSVNEAVPLDELDESAVRSGYADAQREMSGKEAGSLEHATAQTEANVYQAMGRALGITL